MQNKFDEVWTDLGNYIPTFVSFLDNPCLVDDENVMQELLHHKVAIMTMIEQLQTIHSNAINPFYEEEDGK